MPRAGRRASIEERLDGLRQTFPSRGPAEDHASRFDVAGFMRWEREFEPR